MRLKLVKYPYEQRLKRLNLPTMRYRTLKSDRIETYKLLTSRYNNHAANDGKLEILNN